MARRNYIDDVARAISFLSRIPVASSYFEGYDGNLGRVSRTFPLAGALIAMPATAVLGLLLAFRADPLIAAFLSLGALTLTTGALHEDGLSDTADGLGGGKDRERALQIMKDSRIGTYGAVALFFSFAIRAAALAAIARDLPALSAALTIPAVAALSRGALVWHWSSLPAAKSDGVAAAAGQPGSAEMRTALVTAAAVFALLLWPDWHLIPLISSAIVAALCAYLFTGYVRRKLSGHTGDTIGATQQICEVAAFCTLAICL
jgi:adenosylcobinamide-GDP ribazoletransferase